MVTWRSLAVFALCAFAAPAHAAEEVLFGEPPSWVVDFERAEAAAFDADLPAHARLTDFQSRLEAGRTAHYIALEIEVLKSEGLAAGNLSLSWQPEFDELTVHHVLIERDGEVMDVLGEGQTFTVMRREQNLEEAVLTGILTANMFPSGLQVGDVLRLAYTVVSENPVLAGHAEAPLGPLNGIVGQTHVRISWPDDLGVHVRSTQDLPTLERSHRGGQESVTLEMGLREPALPPAGAPPRFHLVRMVEASTFDTWGEVAQLFVPLYESASRIPAQGPLRDALEEIRNASDSPVTRTEMALALVQSRIRYVALAMGAGGLIPADAATTWSRRYGDCKAKTALLLGLLKELGIEAEPVLVNSALGDALPQRLPMVSAFDHVLVRAHIAGEDHFLDGTRQRDNSLARITTPHFVWGLPVIESGADLVSMIAPALVEPDDETTVRIDASAGLRAPAPVQVETVLRGDSAIAIDAALAQYIGQTRRQVLEQYWRERYDYVKPESVDMRFDQASGEARVTLTGTATLDWDYNSFEPNGMRVGYTPDFTREPGPGSDAPFAVPHPFYEKTSFLVTLPDGFTEADIDGTEVDQIVAGIEYRRELSLADNLFTATRSARSLAHEFPAADAEAAKQSLTRLWEQRVFLRIPDSYRLTRAEIETMAKAENDSARGLRDEAAALMDQAEWRAARSVLDKLMQIEPSDQWGLANSAVVHAQLGNHEETRLEAAKALEIAPNNWVPHHALGILAMRDQDYALALAEFSRAIELNENNGFALQHRAMAHAVLRDFEAALADATKLVAIAPEGRLGYMVKGSILAQIGREDELAAHVEDMLSRFPDEPGLRLFASELFFQIGADDEAQALTEEALDDDPPAAALVLSAGRRPTGETEMRLAELDAALRIEPDFLPALLMRANTLWMEYRFEAALADADRVLELYPGHPEAYTIKVKVLLDTNRRREAIRLVDELVEKSATDARGLATAASLYERLDNLNKARATVERAREIAPGDPHVRTMAEHLSSYSQGS